MSSQSQNHSLNTSKIVVGLDVGTTKVCTLIGKRNHNDELEIIGVGSHPSHGLKKGTVVNIDKTIRSIRCSIEEARMMAGISIDTATVGIAGNHIYCFNSSGVVGVKNKEITREDVSRVIEAAKAVLIPSDREILHVIAQDFTVDNCTGIKDPIGMCGVRLEVNVHIVTGHSSSIHNLVKCVEQAGIVTQELILQPIASSKAVLSDEERDLGVVLVDIGGGTTDLAIWKDGSLVHSQIIPLGGNHFTNDLAVALKIPHTEAERVKIHHGTVLIDKINSLNKISVQGITGTKERDVALISVAEVLAARAEELFNTIKQIIQDRSLREQVLGGFVLTGGGALISGMVELGEYLLDRPVKIGYPYATGGMTNVMRDPRFSTVLGLMHESTKSKIIIESDQREDDIPENHKALIQRLSDSFKSVFKELF